MISGVSQSQSSSLVVIKASVKELVTLDSSALARHSSKCGLTFEWAHKINSHNLISEFLLLNSDLSSETSKVRSV